MSIKKTKIRPVYYPETLVLMLPADLKASVRETARRDGVSISSVARAWLVAGREAAHRDDTRLDA